MNRIDLEQLISSKKPGLTKWIPGFIIRYLKRTIHQDEFNELLAKHGEKRGVPFIEAGFSHLNIHFSAHGLEHVPQGDRYIFVANHPLGGIDGTILLKTVIENFGPAKFIVNDILMNLPNLADLLIGINKHGKQSLDTYKKVENLYASNQHVCYFPAGLCSRKMRGEICDLEWKKSIISKSRQYQRDIVPVYFEGRNSDWFYNLSNWRKRLGIRVNIEMLYLIDELYKQRGNHISLHFGKPISYTTFTKVKKDHAWAEDLRQHVYALKNNPQATFSTHK